MGEWQEMGEERKLGVRLWGFVGQDKDIGFYFMCDRKVWENLKQGIYII